MALGPHILLLVHQAVKELVRGPRSVASAILFNLRLAALLFDGPEVALDRDVDPGFLPGFAGGGFDFALVGFPAALWEDPAFAGRGLDEEDLGAVGGEGDDAGYEALALGAVSRGGGVLVSFCGWRQMLFGLCGTSACPGRLGRAWTSRVVSVALAP